jgi:hypothetical protein
MGWLLVKHRWCRHPVWCPGVRAVRHPASGSAWRQLGKQAAGGLGKRSTSSWQGWSLHARHAHGSLPSGATCTPRTLGMAAARALGALSAAGRWSASAQPRGDEWRSHVSATWLMLFSWVWMAWARWTS